MSTTSFTSSQLLAVNNGQTSFRLGLVQGNPPILVIATQDMNEQARYTAASLGAINTNGNVIWIGSFNAPLGTHTNSFAGNAQYRSVEVGRYQYVLNPGGRPVVVRLNVGPLNNNIVPPSGVLRLLP